MRELEFGEKVAAVLYLIATAAFTAGTFLNNGGVGGALLTFGACTGIGAFCLFIWTQITKY